jgi:uncharacterized membrane protein YphA (DoxX/SURF4 family)
MRSMDDSMAHVRAMNPPLELPAWKNVLSVSSAVILAALFIIAGTWKITDPYDAATRMVQAKVPGSLGLTAAISFGIAETFAAVLLLVPRFRRWGAWLTGVMLIAFMIYIGYHYEALRGEECSCFPWVKRAVGPGFFIADGAMLALAVFAGVWARPSESKRSAAIVLGAVAVFAFASLGVAFTRQSGVQAPDTITVNGQPYSLQTGKQFIYFFDPECGHCVQAARTLSTYNWGDTKIVGVYTRMPQFAPAFLTDTGLKAVLTPDHDLLKKTFPFADAPFAVAIENGRQKASFIHFEGDEPGASLKKLGFIE